MDPNSSLRKICLGDDVVIISSDKVEGSEDWNSPEYQDTTVSKRKKVVNTLSFYMMETDEISERYIAPCFVNGLEAYDEPDPFEDDYEKTGKSSDDWDQLLDFNFDNVPKFAGSHLTQEEAKKKALTVRINQKFALLEEERHVIETMAYKDKYKKILDEI
nr:hypothetical protein [Tanacetum cinerariifolium]